MMRVPSFLLTIAAMFGLGPTRGVESAEPGAPSRGRFGARGAMWVRRTTGNAPPLRASEFPPVKRDPDAERIWDTISPFAAAHKRARKNAKRLRDFAATAAGRERNPNRPAWGAGVSL